MWLEAWAQPILTVLGIITLVTAWLAWWERRRTINLQVARRARRVQRVLDEWLKHPALIVAATLTSGDQTTKLAEWVKHVIQGEDEVQTLLEQMLDTAGGASRDVQRDTQMAYSQFLHASDLINNWGRKHFTPATSHAEQADAAKAHMANVRDAVARIVPKDLL